MIMTVLIDANGISELHRKLIPIQDEFIQSGPSENCFPWCMVSYERYTKNNLEHFEFKNMFSFSCSAVSFCRLCYYSAMNLIHLTIKKTFLCEVISLQDNACVNDCKFYQLSRGFPIFGSIKNWYWKFACHIYSMCCDFLSYYNDTRCSYNFIPCS